MKVDRIRHALYIKCMKLTVKYFLLADILILGGHLRHGLKHFPLTDMFYLGGLSFIRVLHSGKYGTFLDMTVPVMLHQLLKL